VVPSSCTYDRRLSSEDKIGGAPRPAEVAGELEFCRRVRSRARDPVSDASRYLMISSRHGGDCMARRAV